MINYEWPKAPFITHADLVFVIERIEGCNNNPESYLTAKVNEHVPSGFQMSTILSFKSTGNNHDV